MKALIKRNGFAIAIILLILGFSITSVYRFDEEPEVKAETVAKAAPPLPLETFAITVEAVEGDSYYAIMSDDSNLYFTQDDILTVDSRLEVGDVAYAYFAQDPMEREDTFIAVMK